MAKEVMRSICVFCGSSDAVAEEFKSVARELGIQMGKNGFQLVYGGASIGLMGEVARGVHAYKGHVLGVLPKFFMKKEIRYDEADELIVTEDMRERKGIMDEKSDAFIVLPGGIGTLEEAVEILSMIQLKLTKKPLVFLNAQGYFDGLFAHIQHMVDYKFAKSKTLHMYSVQTDVDSTLDFIQKHLEFEEGERE